jgi:hypothetical protein
MGATSELAAISVGERFKITAEHTQILGNPQISRAIRQGIKAEMA